LVGGKKIAQVARQEQLSRQWTSREAHQPQTEVLIAELLDRHGDRIEKLVERSIKVIEEAFEAEKVAVTKEGDILELGPDHYARLQSVRRLITLALAGRKIGTSIPEQPAGGRLRTMDEIRTKISGGHGGRSSKA
jgi:hypothetical protein